MGPHLLLSVDEMRRAETAAIAGGLSGAALMEQAGAGVADLVLRAWEKRPVGVLCGPGNNGGDGFVIARRLQEAGWPVKVGLVGAEVSELAGDAKLMATHFDGAIEAQPARALEGAGLIIDAIFGTGLARPLAGDLAALIEMVNRHPAPVMAVDLPSGVNADTGAVMGTAVQASRTATFFRRKPGHVLFPGRALCGAVDLVDIGIGVEALKDINPLMVETIRRSGARHSDVLGSPITSFRVAPSR